MDGVRNIVELEKLNFGYGKDELFHDASLRLEPGNIYGLLGVNGAGKSTLLRLIAGLLFPSSGGINVLGYEPAKRSPTFLSALFVLPETFVLPTVTDKEYIKMLAPFYPSFEEAQLERFLQEFEVPRGRELNKLSQGQQKKFLLSFGLACNAKLLLLDEPTNGLDIPSKGLFRRLVAESLTEDQTILVSTHQVRDLESLIDAIIILSDGSVLCNKDISEMTSYLRMSLSTARPEADEYLLYSEPTLSGFASLWCDKGAPGGQLDFELLFKAVINSSDKFAELFERKEKDYE